MARFFTNATIYGLDIIHITDIWAEIKNKHRIKLGRFDAYDTIFLQIIF